MTETASMNGHIGSDAFLDCRGVEKQFGGLRVLSSLDLAVKQGEFLSLLGPSGCGKTTLLRLIAGLLQPSRGSIWIGGDNVTNTPTNHRNIGVVFQTYALFPHLSVEENVAFGLKARRVPKAEVGPAVAKALDMVRLRNYATRAITSLSGGQQQRIAVARALAVQPRLLLLDEPFSALDRKLRETMQVELRALLRGLGITSIFVTHDQDEAFAMSDRIAVMNGGVIDQLDRPSAIYDRPSTPFALEFVGLSSRLSGTVTRARDGVVTVDTEFGEIRASGVHSPGSKVMLAVRPEHIRLAGNDKASENENRITTTLSDIVSTTGKQYLHFRASRPDQILVETRNDLESASQGMSMTLSWPSEKTMAFPVSAPS